MKKLKFLGTTLLVASLLFTGCPSPSNSNGKATSDPTQTETGDNDETEDTGDSEDTGDTEDTGDVEDENENDYEAPAIESYYKNYLVSSPASDADKAIADWGAGSSATRNDDGTYTITASAGMWGGVPGVCTPFTNFTAGTFANYEYIVFTIDTTNFVLDNTDDGDGNNGVNVKIPEVQKDISSNYVADGNVRTYYAPMSLFGTAPDTAVEMAIIIGGTGTLKLNEVYLAAAEDPSNKAVTGITISPTNASIAQGGSQQFTVKDSNHEDRTSTVSYALSGDAAEGSSITEAGLLTAGTTAGTLTVTATYTVGEENFTSSSTITVLESMTNLVNTVALSKYIDSSNDVTENGDIVSITDNTVTLNKPEDGAWGEWSCQLFLDVTASEGNIFAAGKKYYVSVEVESSAALTNCVWKEDSKATIYQHPISYEAGVAKVLTAEIEPTEDMSLFKCLLSFPGAASTIKVSNITVYDITE
ncbi:MAG: Ig-like domain-containing protein [Treponema sp.]|nr:Ig-like domain-containing protein [Treponema sp.]